MGVIDLRRLGQSTYDRGTAYGPYVTTCHELIWIEEGVGSLTSVEGSYQLFPGSVCLAMPGERLTYTWDTGSPSRHGWIHFSIPSSFRVSPRVRKLRSDDIIHSLVTHISWLERSRPARWQDLAAEALGYVIDLFTSGSTASNEAYARPYHPAVRRSLRFAHAQWSETGVWKALTLTSLAAAAKVTPEHLCRVYRRELGCGPSEALRLLRLDRAATLLVRSSYLVSEVAQLTGFVDQFHFSRTFKSVYGAPPTRFRREQHLGQNLPAELRNAIANL